MHHLLAQIVLLGLRNQNLRLLRQARHVRETRRSTARTHTYEALLRLPMQGLRANVARLPLGVLGAFLGRDRDGLLVFFFRVNYFRATAALDNRTQLFVAALPVQLLALPPAVARLADASRRVMFEGGSALGALEAKHHVNGTCSLMGSCTIQKLISAGLGVKASALRPLAPRICEAAAS